MQYDLSIIIVNYNTANLVKDCLLSIKKTTNNFSSPKLEVILVDNGSSDFDKLSKLADTNIRIIRNYENLGFSRANNQGIREASGKYILLLNSDTKVEKDALQKLLDFAKSHEDAGVVGARLLNGDKSLQDSVFYFPTIARAFAEFWLGKKIFSKYSPIADNPISVDAVMGAAFLITPSALKKVGLLDERYFFYFEDLDYCRRVSKSGLKVYYLPCAEVTHLHGAAGKKLADENNQWRRLIPGSKIYHGFLGHELLNFVIWSGQKWQRIFGKL